VSNPQIGIEWAKMGLNQVHEGTDEGTPPKNEGADMECGPQAVAGIDRCAVVRGRNGARGRRPRLTGRASLAFFGLSVFVLGQTKEITQLVSKDSSVQEPVVP
jgi:hypothetical protein